MRFAVHILAFLLTLGFLRAEVPVDASRYQVILDRAMFGRPAPAAPVAPPPVRTAPAAPSWAQDFRVTMMTLDEYSNQVRVGLQNIKDNSGYLLLLGDKNDQGYELVRADFSRGQATISWQGDARVFSLESGPVDTPAAAAPENPDRAALSRSFTNRSRPTVPTRVIRAEPTPVPESAFQTQEELDAHLKNYQMEVLRQGLPPLPIPLTPEMDQQLVTEGVLPPQ